MESARPAAPADIETLVHLARAARAELAAMRGGPIWAAREAAPEPLAEHFAELLDRSDALVVVGTIDRTILGYGAVELEGLRDGGLLAVVTDLYVEPEARAVGIGEAMLELLVLFAGQRGCTGVDALALPGHRATKNFFEESGFTARMLVMHRELTE